MRRVAVVFVTVLCLPALAGAKDRVVLSLSTSKPAAQKSVHVVVRASGRLGHDCRMQLLAVAPGVSKYRALDAFIIGGYSVNGPQGNTFHPLEPTRRMGFLRSTTRVGPKAWRATVRFPRAGTWHLIVPNWCAPGYAGAGVAERLVTVR
jgi:hypothetical protein